MLVSVSQRPQAPRVPGWERDDILEYIKDRYDLKSDQDCIDEFGVGISSLISLADALEPGRDDWERQSEMLERESAIEEDYETRAYRRDLDTNRRGFDKKVIHMVKVYDPDNPQAWYQRNDVRYVEED